MHTNLHTLAQILCDNLADNFWEVSIIYQLAQPSWQECYIILKYFEKEA